MTTENATAPITDLPTRLALFSQEVLDFKVNLGSATSVAFMITQANDGRMIPFTMIEDPENVEFNPAQHLITGVVDATADQDTSPTVFITATHAKTVGVTDYSSALNYIEQHGQDLFDARQEQLALHQSDLYVAATIKGQNEAILYHHSGKKAHGFDINRFDPNTLPKKNGLISYSFLYMNHKGDYNLIPTVGRVFMDAALISRKEIQKKTKLKPCTLSDPKILKDTIAEKESYDTILSFMKDHECDIVATHGKGQLYAANLNDIAFRHDSHTRKWVRSNKRSL